MRLQNLINLSILIGFTLSYDCSDNWELVYRNGEAFCWDLIHATSFNANFDTISNECTAAQAEPVAIRNRAEKSVLIDLANRMREPTLTCYKVSQSAIEGEFKIVDFEEPPEYLRVLNEEKRVKLSRKIQRDDHIIVTFSMKLSTEDLNVPNGIIQIGSSTNKSSYAIRMDCRFKPPPVCSLKHPLTTTLITIEMYAAELKKELTVEYFGRVQFDFLDKEIRVWGSKKKLTVSSEHPYTEMDEISIEHLIVSSIEHTKHGGDLAQYSFETNTFDVEEFPKLNLPADNEKDDRMPLGASYTFIAPETKFDYFGLENKNTFVFDIKLLKQMKAVKRWNDIGVDFWNRRTDQPVFQLHLNDDHYDFKPSNKPKFKKFEFGNLGGYDLLGIRFEVSVKKGGDMTNKMTIKRTGIAIDPVEISRPFANFHEIRLTANTSEFYEVTMKSLRDVVITTCNYRNLGFGITQKEVPYRSEIFKKRNILCEKKALNLDAKPPQDSVEEYIWREKEEVKPEISTTVEPIEEIEKIERNASKFNESLIDELKKEESLGEIQNVALFQWSIIAMTTLTFASFTATIVLNLIRYWQ